MHTRDGVEERPYHISGQHVRHGRERFAVTWVIGFGMRLYSARRQAKNACTVLYFCLMTDTLGLILFVVVCAASIADSDGAEYMFHETEGHFPRLHTVLVDQGYKGWLVDFAKRWFGIIVDVVSRPPEQRAVKDSFKKAAISLWGSAILLLHRSR
jgi:hypothetical protein